MRLNLKACGPAQTYCNQVQWSPDRHMPVVIFWMVMVWFGIGMSMEQNENNHQRSNKPKHQMEAYNTNLHFILTN